MVETLKNIYLTLFLILKNVSMKKNMYIYLNEKKRSELEILRFKWVYQRAKDLNVSIVCRWPWKLNFFF